MLNHVHSSEKESELIARVWHTFFERIIIIFQYKKEYIIDTFVEFLEKTFGIKLTDKNDVAKLFSPDYKKFAK